MTSISRRSVFKGALGAAAVTLAAGPAIATAQPGKVLPETLDRTRSLAAGRHRAATGGVAPTHLSVSSANSRFRVRTASGWGEWRSIASCPSGRSEASRTAFVRVPEGALEYELDMTEAGSVSELNTVAGRALGRLAPWSAGTSLRGRRFHGTYLSRAAWGANESLRFAEDGSERYPLAYFPVQTLTVHHTALQVGPDPAADVRAIYHDHTITQEFGDIGYHLLIDPAGRVYEGRHSGVDGVPVFGPDLPNGVPQMSNAAHVGGFNAGNVGVCLLGDFTSGEPTRAAGDALVKVLALLSMACGLDPLGRTDYVNPVNGATATVDTISGHRDWLATECPGNAFHPHLPEVRARVAGLLNR
ncbi:peptidoglycan recognition protein family protein [Saccharothrix sp. Mg75]|uniref:peptidoglycan recognition protein family protein n=1 Tax=Saccharothrix sp. Mg75 TaxID=3445357 RepID=UPI003EEFFEBF